MEYGNGYKVEYTHNQWGQPTNIYKNGVRKYGWLTSYGEGISAHTDYENALRTQYFYDSLGRMIRWNTRDTAGSSTVPRYYGEYGYDVLNNVSKMNFRAGGQTLTNSYTYGKDNLPATSVNSKIGTTAYTFDTLGRLNDKNLTGKGTLNTHYYYKLSATRNAAGGELYRSTRLNREQANQHATAYAYDAVGNITVLYEYNIEQGKNIETARYTYDKKNQLTREDNKLQSKSSVFAYDAGGNLVSVKEYAYTTGTLGAVLKTTTYAYDTAWKDKLVSYNGTAITYDAIGNPLNYLGRTLTWEGRQLKTLTKGSISASYKYDAQGLRSYKKVGTEESRYFYLGGKLAYEERGTKKFWYHYDALGALVALTYKNGTATETSYLVYTNNRGDVEALYTMEGNLYARYNYDAWGNTVSITKLNGDAILPSATEIAYLNPIRYRGYYFDQESGLYYLKSRYYDPQVKRFINADAYVKTGQGIMDANMFVYCANNPVAFSDATGTAHQAAEGYRIGFDRSMYMRYIGGNINYTPPAPKPKKSFVEKVVDSIGAAIWSVSLEAGAGLGAGGSTQDGIFEASATAKFDAVSVKIVPRDRVPFKIGYEESVELGGKIIGMDSLSGTVKNGTFRSYSCMGKSDQHIKNCDSCHTYVNEYNPSVGYGKSVYRLAGAGFEFSWDLTYVQEEWSRIWGE